MSHFYLDKISLNGGRTALGSRRALTMISCDPEGQSATTTGQVLTAYPSPDGRMIARVDSATDCEMQNTTITFLDADTLAAIGDPFIVSQPSRESLGLTDYAWLEDGRFARVQMTALGPAGSSYAPNTEPESIADLSYDCFFPPTTSGDMNEAGEYVGLSDGVVQVSPPDPAALTFGCPDS
ncbi:MAG: hypothetical protein VYD19_00650 [Myxococcota bacterium]|nr:hypothetical protein [Myxococcota bacterium]